MDPATVLTKEDYEHPRTVEQLWDWWHAKYKLLASTREGRVFSREGKGLTKKFHDEAHPMLAFLRHYHLGSDLLCRLTAGDEEVLGGRHNYSLVAVPLLGAFANTCVFTLPLCTKRLSSATPDLGATS